MNKLDRFVSSGDAQYFKALILVGFFFNAGLYAGDILLEAQETARAVSVLMQHVPSPQSSAEDVKLLKEQRNLLLWPQKIFSSKQSLDTKDTKKAASIVVDEQKFARLLSKQESRLDDLRQAQPGEDPKSVKKQIKEIELVIQTAKFLQQGLIEGLVVGTPRPTSSKGERKELARQLAAGKQVLNDEVLQRELREIASTKLINPHKGVLHVKKGPSVATSSDAAVNSVAQQRLADLEAQMQQMQSQEVDRRLAFLEAKLKELNILQEAVDLAYTKFGPLHIAKIRSICDQFFNGESHKKEYRQALRLSSNGDNVKPLYDFLYAINQQDLLTLRRCRENKDLLVKEQQAALRRKVAAIGSALQIMEPTPTHRADLRNSFFKFKDEVTPFLGLNTGLGKLNSDQTDKLERIDKELNSTMAKVGDLVNSYDEEVDPHNLSVGSVGDEADFSFVVTGLPGSRAMPFALQDSAQRSQRLVRPSSDPATLLPGQIPSPKSSPTPNDRRRPQRQ